MAGERDVDRLEAQAAAYRAEIASLRADLARSRTEDHRLERSQRALIRQLRRDVGAGADELEEVAAHLAAAELELIDLRAVRDALTPPILIQRPGMTLATEFVPEAQQVGGDFFFVGDGPEESVVVVIGDAVGKGSMAARRAAFTRTAFAAVSGFSDEPCQLLEWVNVALVERSSEGEQFVTAACVTFQPEQRVLRWAYAGHPPALQLFSGEELDGARAGLPLGVAAELGVGPTSGRLDRDEGVLMFTDGLIEARGTDDRFGIERVVATIRAHPELAPSELLAELSREASEFAGGHLDDDLCLVALRSD
jgi:serine phosphatase RsbU (regulator of sigma subunit)